MYNISKKFNSGILVSLTFLLVSTMAYSQEVQRIAFGSCNKHDLPQPLWNPIIEDSPEVFVWLGDNVYGDTHDMDLLKRKYDAQKAIEGYQKLRQNAKIIGVWDDHDFGINDGGKHYAQKVASMQLMLDFLDEPKDSPRRSQEGVYGAYEYHHGENSVKIYLLDARYSRDTLYKEDGQYLPNLSGSVLGEEQWTWLEKELKNSKADVNIIASGIQFIPTEHPHEKWENYPKERERLFDLIHSSKVKNPVLLSGDRHIAEISRLKDSRFTKGLYEITSSGMTHVWKSYKEEYNPYRVSGLVASLHYGLASFDWKNKLMNFQIKGEKGQVYIEQTIQILD
ncbi:alkaline phosphatase family protein [Belliella sp. DSM 111904]|uniref:Alkaline phosphatase family protein n=1 Tax=Belliella filtrata TaxID=2923435 RepID=A0ABS9V0N1_9BACT|nr:alkaline phosphatase D family protein [Belliella filtrata]MCH7409962.1 alkaline phosphatase family protein [Belliella filtrata]